MTWAYDAASATIYDTATDDVICRDVDPRYGALIAAAGDMRTMLRFLYSYLACLGAEATPWRVSVLRLLDRTEVRG